MGLGAEVVDLVGVDLVEQVDEGDAVVEVAVVQEQVAPGGVGVLVDAVQALGVEGGGAADDAVDLVALAQQQLGQVRPVLTGDARDQRRFRHTRPHGSSTPGWTKPHSGTTLASTGQFQKRDERRTR